MKKLLLSITAIVFSASVHFAQDVHFSQYNFANMIVNPALTSLNKDVIATINHKEQWRSLKAFRTSHASIEFKLAQPNWIKQEHHTGYFMKRLQKGLAIGIDAFSDNAAGVIKHSQVNVSLAYHVQVSKTGFFSLGLIGGYSSRRVDIEGLRWADQYTFGNYDSSIPHGEVFRDGVNYGDFGVGLAYSVGEGSRYSTANDQKNLNFGLSALHVNKPNSNFGYADEENLNIRYNAHFNSLYGIENSQYSIGPSAIFMKQGPLKELTFGTILKYKMKNESQVTGFIKSSAVSLGLFYRTADALIPQLIYEINSFAVGVSYDINLSAMTPATMGRGGVEIMLRFNNPNPFLFQNKSRI